MSKKAQYAMLWVVIAVSAGLVIWTSLRGAPPEEVRPAASPSVASTPVASTRSKWSKLDVQTGCREYVETQMVSPRSMQLGDDFFDVDPVWDAAARRWRFSFSVESQNAFGVWLPSRWLCEVVDDEYLRVAQLP